ncbi:MAG TPA: YceD family protein [Steroidobacteraceae bacterium]|nr:YceD family protein [Steroidobacteraceae bacterium]
MSRDRAEWHEVQALVARAAQVRIDCALRDLPRIAPLLTRDDGSATAAFRFYRLSASADAPEGTISACDAAECSVSAVLPMTCQRCLGEVQIQAHGSAHLAFIDDEAAVGTVPESHDPVIMSAGRVSLAELVEEELLLAMPIVPVHAEVAQCQPRPGETVEENPADAAASAPKQTPFAGLRELMKK